MEAVSVNHRFVQISVPLEKIHRAFQVLRDCTGFDGSIMDAVELAYHKADCTAIEDIDSHRSLIRVIHDASMESSVEPPGFDLEKEFENWKSQEERGVNREPGQEMEI